MIDGCGGAFLFLVWRSKGKDRNGEGNACWMLGLFNRHFEGYWGMRGILSL